MHRATMHANISSGCPYLCCMSTVSMLFIHAAFLCLMSLLHDLAACSCCMFTSMLLVHKACLCCISMLKEHVKDKKTYMDMDMDWETDTDLDPGMETDNNTYMGIAMDMVLEDIQ